MKYHIISLVLLVSITACANTPVGKIPVDAFLAADKVIGGGQTLTETALQEHERGETLGTVKNAFFNVIMMVPDLVFSGTVACHGYVWRYYEQTGEAKCVKIKPVAHNK